MAESLSGCFPLCQLVYLKTGTLPPNLVSLFLTLTGDLPVPLMNKTWLELSLRGHAETSSNTFFEPVPHCFILVLT